MRRRRVSWSCRVTLAVCAVGFLQTAVMMASVLGQVSGPLAKQAKWQPPGEASVLADLTRVLKAGGTEPAAVQSAVDRWKSLADETPLDRWVEALAEADARVRQLREAVTTHPDQIDRETLSWVRGDERPGPLSANARLYLARSWVQRSMFDEAAEQLDGLEPEDVVDPAALLFYQGLAAYQVLDQPRGLQRLEMLLSGEEYCPRRFVVLGRLMRTELELLEPDSLGHIARRMEDIRRRLDLGRAGPRVREIEQGVIESLDKLIEEAEKQRQQSSSSNSNSPAPAQAAEESRIMGGKGRGEVTKKSIGTEGGWGSLPPKEREEALQEIGRQFPGHYRDVVEQYFRQLAGEGSE